MQVYRDLRLITSRPLPADERSVDHRLYGVAGASDAWSAGRWLDAAGEVLREIRESGRVAVVTGGTGLYFKVLEQGLSPVPPVPGPVREKWRAALAREGAPALHARLAGMAAQEAVRLEPGDGQRIVRALEVLEATGEPLSAHFARGASGAVLAGCEVRRVALVPDRGALYERCDARFSAMMAAGALEEVRALAALDLDPALPVMKAIGVRALREHLDGQCPLDEAVAIAQRETRNYAKRQMTWIRNQMADWPVRQTVDDAVQWLTGQ